MFLQGREPATRPDSRAADAGDFGQGDQVTRQVVDPLGGFQVGPAYGFGEFKVPRASPGEGGHVASTPKKGPEVMAVGADIKSLGAVNAKPDDRNGNFQDFVFVDANPTRRAIDRFAFAGQLVERDAVFLDGRDHRRDLIELPGEFLECRLDGGVIEGGDTFAFKNFAGGVLGVGGFTEFERSLVLLVLGHEKVLDPGGTANHQHEQTGGNGIEGAAMAHLALTKPAADEVNDIVGGAPRRFVNQEEAVELGDHFGEKIAYRLQAVAYEEGV